MKKLFCIFLLLITSITYGATISTEKLVVVADPYVDIRSKATIDISDTYAISLGKSLLCASPITLPTGTITSPVEAKKGCYMTCGSGTTVFNAFSAGEYQVFDSSCYQKITLSIPLAYTRAIWGAGLANQGSGSGQGSNGGTVTSVVSTNGDIVISNPTITPDLSVSTGTSANKIVRLDSSARLPAVSGALLTGLTFNMLGGTPTTGAGYGITDLQPLSSNLTQVSAVNPAACNGKYGTWAGGVYTCGTINVSYPPAGIPFSTGIGWTDSLIPNVVAITENSFRTDQLATDFVVADFVNIYALKTNGTNTMTKRINAVAPTTAMASINLPHGTAPNSPVNGDCWTTTSGLYCRVSGSTVGPYLSSNSVVSDAAYSTTWNADTDHAPSKNSVYDFVSTLQSRLTGSCTTGYVPGSYNADGSANCVLSSSNVDASQVASGTLSSNVTWTVPTSTAIKAGGGTIESTILVGGGNYTATFQEAGLSSNQSITVPDRTFTLDNVNSSTTTSFTGLLYAKSGVFHQVTFGSNITFDEGTYTLDSIGGAGGFGVTTSTQTTDTTLTVGNFGSTGINPLRVGDARYKLPSATSNLYRPLTSRGTATIWPASPSDVITLNGTALTASNQVQCTKGPLWITGFAANDWSIDGANCTDGGKPVLTSNPTPTLAFGSVSSSTTSTVGFTNTGNALATLGTPTLSGTDKARFTLNNACSSTLATSATCSIGVLFDATVGGPYAASLDYPYYNTTKSVAISGTGISGGNPCDGASPSGCTAREKFNGCTNTLYNGCDNVACGSAPCLSNYVAKCTLNNTTTPLEGAQDESCGGATQGTQLLVAAADEYYATTLFSTSDVTKTTGIFNLWAGVGTTGCQAFPNSSKMSISNSGGTTRAGTYTLVNNTKYYLKIRAKKGSGSNAECEFWLSSDGTNWTLDHNATPSNNGTWTSQIDRAATYGSSATHTTHFDDLRIFTGDINY